ncbi:MAG: MFS transporter, partial [Bacteroidales bacterium]|nr:MFS transporter [Bacteroidales bacterium]
MTKKNTNMVAIVTMCFIFAMISFVTNMAAPFGNIWGNKFEWSKMAGNLMNFAAYLFMGIPAGKMLVKIGYKKTTLVALATGFFGIVIQWISSKIGADTSAIVVYLIGAFVCGLCVCMLNTVVNPMLNILGGGGNKGNQYIQIGGTLNSLTGTFTPLLVGALIGTVTANTSMSDVTPLLFIAMAVFAVAFIIISMVKIPEPAQERNALTYEHSPWNFRHFVLG